MTKCIKCASDHNMVWEDTRTGETTPLDYCKTCFFGLYEYHPIQSQIKLHDVEEQYIKLQRYLMENYMQECLLYGWHEKIENIPPSMIDQWDEAYKQWEDYFRTVPIDCHFVPPDEPYEVRVKKMAESLAKSQSELVKNAANHANLCSLGNPSDLPAISFVETPNKNHEDLNS